ncbi:MAG: hypothetical protein KAJ22_01875 [Candidatus Izimaplasma sp.]|nr:hypothetical protein [Candidatus Izimaplasma bacterium]
MKKILLIIVFVFVFLLTSCKSSTYIIVSDEPVDGYFIYQKEVNGMFCNTTYEDIYYSGETYNYGYSFKGCSADMSFFIKDGISSYTYLGDALEQRLISLDSLIPELMQLNRNPEEIMSDEADYYWLDFHIDGSVVYAYAGGECDQNGKETFIINGKTYVYNASGCLKDNILFMRIEGVNTPIATLLNDGSVNGEYLIPLLEEQFE